VRGGHQRLACCADDRNHGLHRVSKVFNVSTDWATDPLAAGRSRGCRLGKHPQRFVSCHAQPAQTHGRGQDLRLLEYHGLGPLHKPRRFRPGFLTASPFLQAAMTLRHAAPRLYPY
jgi:hypothetical protein